MSLRAASVFLDDRSSAAAGRRAGAELAAQLGGPARAALAYLTIQHDAPAFLAGLREVLGDGVALAGSSAQGVIGRGGVRETGYAASVIALGGDVRAGTARAADIGADTRAKGAAIGRALRDGVGGRPRVVVLHYDPVSHADASALLDAIHGEVDCPIVGGASSHPFGVPIGDTHQYAGGDVLRHSASALALAGDFAVEIGACTGCAPVGVELTVTRADGTTLLELDGRPALDVWRELTASSTDRPSAEDAAALALGVPLAPGHQSIRAAFTLDAARRGITLQAAVAEGTRVMLHHRTVDDVLGGARRMADGLVARLAGRAPRAVLAFECGARTLPFLGAERTLQENLALQRAVAPDAAWCGFMPWGELFPVGGRPTFHNYTYPVVVLAEAGA